MDASECPSTYEELADVLTAFVPSFRMIQQVCVGVGSPIIETMPIISAFSTRANRGGKISAYFSKEPAKRRSTG